MDVRQGFQVAPGKCFVCSTPDPSVWVIDTCQDDPAEVRRARVYLCANCVVAAAKMLTPYTGVHVVSTDALSTLHESAQQAEALRTRAEAAEGKLAELRDFVVEGAV